MWLDFLTTADKAILMISRGKVKCIHYFYSQSLDLRDDAKQITTAFLTLFRIITSTALIINRMISSK